MPSLKISRLRVFLAACGAVASVSCRDLTSPPASLNTFTDSLTVFPLNMTPPDAPNAIDLNSGTAVRVNSSFAFDFAVDLDSLGRLVLLPLRVVASELTATHDVGFQSTTIAYDSLGQAPTDGYVYDSVFVVKPATTTLIAVNNSAFCTTSIISTVYYAKFKVDSVSRDNSVHVRFVVDPNCGFRDLTPGVLPKG